MMADNILPTLSDPRFKAIENLVDKAHVLARKQDEADVLLIRACTRAVLSIGEQIVQDLHSIAVSLKHLEKQARK